MNYNLAQMLIRTARAHPHQAALFLGTERLCNFEQLADRATRCAGGLRGWLGLHAGDRQECHPFASKSATSAREP
ncbi:hypothetical protein [Cupriavidus sp. H39]|uniref:hypothetical protein n=1 Tax=Cupriavidus sp. H39 TaxID=3401635 RepID=UPI003D048BBA